MRFSFAVLAGALTASCAFVACGIDDSFDGTVYEPGGPVSDGGGTKLGDSGGTTTPDGGVTVTPEGGPVEAGPPPPPAPCSVPPGACIAALPAGWTIVSYQASQATPCADPFTATDVVTNPVAGANACGCGCTVTTAPVCDNGSFSFMTSNGSDATCGGGGSTITVNGGDCHAFGGGGANVAGHGKAPAIPPSGGVCTAAATTNAAGVTTTAARICNAPTNCQEQLCAPDGGTGGGYATCITQSGMQSCPTGWGSPVVVGTTASLACANDCTCDVNGASSCTNAKLSVYSDNTCATLDTDIAIDGNCNANAHGGDNVKSWKYGATLNQQCNTAGSKTATVGVNGPQTVCCRP